MSRNIYDYINDRNLMDESYRPIVECYSKDNLRIIIYGGDVEIYSIKEDELMCPIFYDTIDLSEKSYDFLDSIMKAEWITRLLFFRIDNMVFNEN